MAQSLHHSNQFVARYHERADECAKLAELATSDRVREHYRQIAQNYLKLARSELARMEPQPSNRSN